MLNKIGLCLQRRITYSSDCWYEYKLDFISNKIPCNSYYLGYPISSVSCKYFVKIRLLFRSDARVAQVAKDASGKRTRDSPGISDGIKIINNHARERLSRCVRDTY